MPTPWTHDEQPLDVLRLLRTLDGHRVRHIVVGGVAAIAHGYPGTTLDADIVPDMASDNLHRLVRALRELDARIYVEMRRTDLAPDGSPPEAGDLDLEHPETLRRQLVWQFSTSAGRLDILLVIDAAGDYRELSRAAVEWEVAGVSVRVASLDDLIESKEMAGRDKDLRALGELRRLRDEQRRDQEPGFE